MFYSDKPISSNNEDKLNRKGFAKLLAHTLVHLDSKDTFTVGLFGKWGCGKTSLVNMTLAEIENIQAENETEQIIVVHFELWNFTDIAVYYLSSIIYCQIRIFKDNLKQSSPYGHHVKTSQNIFDFCFSCDILLHIYALFYCGEHNLLLGLGIHNMGEINQKCQVPTPPEIVVQMLDHIGYTQNLYGKRVLENSCGTGNFLIEIVNRYIQDCIAHNYTFDQIKFGLSRDIHAFEKDRRVHKQCINNLAETAANYGITGVHWNVKRKNALHAAKAGRYQFVVGNPPYLAYPELDNCTRKHIRKHFSSCSKGKPDYYYAFIESALKSLALDGKLAYLVPGNFMKNLYSEDLRQLILPSLYEITDYSHHRIFNDVLTSSVIIYCDQTLRAQSVRYEDKHYKRIYVMEKTQMQGKWLFSEPSPSSLINFSNYYHASAPVATQLNDAFVVSNWDREDDLHIFIGNHSIEKAVLRNTAGPKALQRNLREVIIFPYSYDNDGTIVRLTEEYFHLNFPGAYNYLLQNQDKLLLRKADTQAMWFEYGRSQLLTHLNQPKLVLSSFITNQPRVYLLDAETVPYAGICVVSKNSSDITKAQAILNSPEFMEYVRKVGVCTNGVSYRISPTDINKFQFPPRLLEE